MGLAFHLHFGQEQAGEDALHHPAVLKEVGHPRGAAEVVLQHPSGARAIAHQIKAGDVAPAVDRFEPLDQALLQPLPLAGGDQPGQGIEGEDALHPLAAGIVEAEGGAEPLEQHAGGGAGLRGAVRRH